jgi:phytochrome-interacting factor 4
MMWMAIGIAAPPPVMFPGVHQYLPRMGPAAAAMPRMPFMAPQPVVPSLPVVNPRGHHMPAVGITEPYVHYQGVNHHQPTPTHQVRAPFLNFFFDIQSTLPFLCVMFGQHFAQGVGYYPLGAKAVQQSPAIHAPTFEFMKKWQ